MSANTHCHELAGPVSVGRSVSTAPVDGPSLPANNSSVTRVCYELATLCMFDMDLGREQDLRDKGGLSPVTS